MVETAFHGPVKVGLFLLLCSDFVIVSGRKAGFLFERDSGLCQVIRLAYGACPGDLFVSFFRIVSAFFPLSHKISSFFCFGPYYYVVSRKIFSVFPSVSPVAVVCFCTKLSGICTKQNIFCTKDGGNSCMFFQHFRDFLCGLRIFLLFFLTFSVKESGFLVYLSVF